MSNTGSFTGTFTGDLIGTASFATTASYLLGTVTSASYANTASFAQTASVSINSINAQTASIANLAITATTATSANQVAYSLTMTSSGFGDVPGTNFNGSVARAISYNTIGAPSTTGANASGTWNINITGSAGRATSASFATTASHVTGTITSASFASNAMTAVTAQTASFVNLVAGPNVTINQSGTQFRISGSNQVTPGIVNRVARYDTTSTVSASAILFDDGTNVGIGTTSPAYKLQVSNDALINDKRIGMGPGQQANTVFGSNVLTNNTTGQYNTAIGDYTLQNINNTNENTAVGYYAGRLLTGNYDTVIGSYAGEQATTSGTNVFIGKDSGRYATGSSANVYIGYQTGLNVNGTGNVIIGASAGISQGTALDQSIIIGSSMQAIDPIGTLIDSNYWNTTGIISIGDSTIRYWSQNVYSIASGSKAIVFAVDSATYSAAFIDYAVCEVNAGTPSRAGTFKIHCGPVPEGSYVYTEEVIGEIGDTSNYVFSVTVNGSIIELNMINSASTVIQVDLQCRLLRRMAK